LRPQRISRGNNLALAVVPQLRLDAMRVPHRERRGLQPPRAFDVARVREQSGHERIQRAVQAGRARAGGHVGLAVPERAVHLLGQVTVGGGDAVVPHRLAVAVAEQLPALPQVLVVRIDARADVRIGARPVAGYDVEAFADQADLRAPLPGL